jgi:sec-independent protein translocase protein TatA
MRPPRPRTSLRAARRDHRSLRAARRAVTFGAVLGDLIQPTHLLFILVVALLVLGPKRLPEVGRALGRGMRDFRDAVTHTRSEAHEMLYGEGEDAEPADRALAVATAAPMAASTEPATGATQNAAVAPTQAPPAEPVGGPATATATTGPRSASERLDAEPIYSD